MARSSKKRIPIDTDFHSHLLPDIDCSAPIDHAVKFVADAYECGIENIVLTPHFYPHRHSSVESFTEKRDRSIDKLIQGLKNEGLPSPSFYPAAEVLLCPGLEKLENLGLLCIKNTKTLLIEMPDPPWNDKLYDALEAISDLGYTVVIAHADRYGKNEAESLIKAGYAIQLNADSVCAFGMARLCMSWIKDKRVYALGSDTHVRSNGVPSYKKMIKAASAISDHADLIQDRMHELIGKN